MFIIVFVFAFTIASSCGIDNRLAPAVLPPAANFLRVQIIHSTPSTTDEAENVTGEVKKCSTPRHHRKQVAQFLVHFRRLIRRG
jgi:hypothetical protein